MQLLLIILYKQSASEIKLHTDHDQVILPDESCSEFLHTHVVTLDKISEGA